MLHPAIGKVSMGTAVEWFKKEELHEQTIAEFTGVSPKMFGVWLWIQAITKLWMIWK
jgi:hypothetical protein